MMGSSTPPDSSAALEAYVAAFSIPSDDATSELRQLLADDVTLVGPMARASGRGDVVTAATNPMLAGLLGTAEWSEPQAEDDSVIVRATVPPGLPLGGIASTIWLDAGGQISRIVQEVIPAAP